MKKIFSILFCAILFCSFLVVPAFASETNYPSVNSIIDEISSYPHYAYFVYKHKDNSNYRLITFTSSSNDDVDFRFLFNTTSKIMVSRGSDYRSFSYTVYVVDDSNTWARSSGTSNVTSHNFDFTYDYEIFEGSHDVTTSSGDVFFQRPPDPPEGLAAVIQEETLLAQEKITQTMKIILLCGVGCLALLIVLVVLGKVLKIFPIR